MSKKVLIIDDDSDFVEAISTLLEAKGYEVISAAEGKSGVSEAKKQLPGLILLDVMMTTNIPVILVTGIKRDMNLPFGFEPDEDWLPVKAVLEKPVKPDVLLKAVEENIIK
jgi:response regulator RpfG family c-di-GMP phosphodiesterase